MEFEGANASQKETVLVVEDDCAVNFVVTEALTRAGYEVLMVDHVEQALTTAEEHRGHLDLVITDLIMPGMNGRKVAELICAADPSVRVLFMSGYTEDLLEEEDADVEDAPFIAKPFTIDQLLRKVEEVIHPEAVG